MTIPAEQSAEHHYLGQKARSAPSETRQSSAAATTPHRRHGDRGSDDDAASRLPFFVRYKDLVATGICDSYRQLYNMIDNDGFP
jgi:hypothetical protein